MKTEQLMQIFLQSHAQDKYLVSGEVNNNLTMR